MESTLGELWVPLMDGPTLCLDRCAICGRPYPLNQHHPVRRSAGELVRDGRRVKKPTITLCGSGNQLADASGRYFCHGLAHAQRLHFRVVDGRWQYLILRTPTPFAEALEMEGWRWVYER